MSIANFIMMGIDKKLSTTAMRHGHVQHHESGVEHCDDAKTFAERHVLRSTCAKPAVEGHSYNSGGSLSQ